MQAKVGLLIRKRKIVTRPWPTCPLRWGLVITSSWASRLGLPLHAGSFLVSPAVKGLSLRKKPARAEWLKNARIPPNSANALAQHRLG
jgi:hypothetical protein